MDNSTKRKPDWLKVKTNTGHENIELMNTLRSLNLNTVCEEANCPNRGECFSKKTATFLILGRNCTRNCRFCNVSKGFPSEIDIDEPQNIAQAVEKLDLRHVVITSVTRDDLPDGGATHFANVIKAIKDIHIGKAPVIEVLIPDFQGDYDALKIVIDANPDIINHNVETVPRLYPKVRPEALYERSLELLRRVKEYKPTIITKSGIMVGLGENNEEVLAVFRDLLDSKCELLTVGQYLAPSKLHHEVIEYIHPNVFGEYKLYAETLGFKHVASGPLVRSSYLAEKSFMSL